MVLLQAGIQLKWITTLKEVVVHGKTHYGSDQGIAFWRKTQAISKAPMKEAEFREDTRRVINLSLKTYGNR